MRDGGPKVLSAVAAVNAPLACSAFVATCLPILADLRLAPASERHLDAVLTLADGNNPPADPAFAERFPQDDPLAAMSL
ncbi:MAG: hypothetical protein JNK92_08095 [Dechloromonas sp.]|nr:hypothetical protein [Dechloromonas sp.]